MNSSNPTGDRPDRKRGKTGPIGPPSSEETPSPSDPMESGEDTQLANTNPSLGDSVNTIATTANTNSVDRDGETNLLSISHSLESGEEKGYKNGNTKHFNDVKNSSEGLLDLLGWFLSETGWEEPVQRNLFDFSTQASEITRLKRVDVDQFASMEKTLQGPRNFFTTGPERGVVLHLQESIERFERAVELSKESYRGYVLWPQVRQTIEGIRPARSRQQKKTASISFAQPVSGNTEPKVEQVNAAMVQAIQELTQAIDAANAVDKGPKREALLIICDVVVRSFSQIEGSLD